MSKKHRFECMKIKILGLLMVAVFASITANAISEKELDAIKERIKPAGSVCLEGDNSCGAAVAVSTGPRSGEEVYNAACLACHTTGAGGAPKIGDVAGWADRITKGIDELYNSGINGLAGTGMIAKGGCMNCSDDEIKAAVDFILDNTK